MLEAGQMLAHYKLVEKIGEGGMGVVWKALDTTLNRDVAIKTLPEGFSRDPDRRGRFEREARLLATLNHPGIAGVYGLHQDGETHFIAMEFIPGEDLAERLARGPLDVEDAIDVAQQVAEALETAHEQGVIHRDLKPANIKRTPEGKIKVLDLGLAKALAPDANLDPGSVSLSPTVTSAGTVAGTLLGTAGYMSPEQVKGKPVDRRADIWAFGCVLHEMLTGKRTFGGETISETLASVLRDVPDTEGLPVATPASVRHLLARCLDRDRSTRLRDIGEARIALSPAGIAAAPAPDSGAAAGAIVAEPTPPSRLPWIVAGVAILAALALAWFAFGGPAPEPAGEIRANINPPEGQEFIMITESAGALSISPDGTRVVFTATTDSGRSALYVRSIGSTTPQLIPDTESGTFPFWSPDSRFLAFFADGKLKKLDVTGGAPLTIADAGDGRGGHWAEDGTILFAPDTQSPIMRVSASGGTTEAVTKLDPSRLSESTHRYPWFLPGGRHFLYMRASHSAGPQEPVNSVWIGDLESDETFELMKSGTQAIYVRGYVFWVHDQFLMARPFSPEKLAFTDETFVIAQGVVVQPDSWRAAFGVSDAGPIVLQQGSTPERTLTWVDRQGTPVGTIGELGKYDEIRLSPDGRRLAATFSEQAGGVADIWVFDLTRNVGSRLTFDAANERSPVWSADGTRIAFESNRTGNADIYIREADGRGEAELLYSSAEQDTPEAWSPDGKHLLFNRGDGAKLDLWALPIDSDEEPFAVVKGNFDEGYARFSPDGNWVGYISNESGRYELYLTPFPDAEGKWQLTKEGADWLIGWKQDGSEIYYLDLETRVCMVPLDLADEVEAGEPRCLFETESFNTWASAASGERFIIGIPEKVDLGYPITMIVNWQPER